MINKILLINLLFVFVHSANSNNPILLIKTSEGSMKIELYEDTPLHTDNFIKLVKDSFYNGLLFHRVIKDFMIQTGDPTSKNAYPGQRLGFGGTDYTIPQEIKRHYYHKKGAIAAARQPDDVNPSKSSSSSQFYIIQGQKLTDVFLQRYVQSGHLPFTSEQIKDYKTVGGSPHLDYQYTIFGQVIDGLEVIDKIAAYSVDKYKRPIKDVKIISIIIISEI